VIQAVGGSFAVDQHGLRDDSPFVAAANGVLTSSGPLPLLLVADPVEPAPGTSDVAHDIVTGMAVYLRHTMERGIREALVAAFKTANERVYFENRSRHGRRRIYLGLSCVVLDGDELYVAQTSPSQVLVWQDGVAHAIPSLSTWSADEITETFSDLSYPLGFREKIEPRMAYSRCAPGDVIAVVSWPLAKHLGTFANLNGVRSAGDFIALVAQLQLEHRSRAHHGAVFELDAGRIARTPTRDNRSILRGPMHFPGLPLDGPLASGDSRTTHRWERNNDGHWRVDDNVASFEDWDRNGSREGDHFDTLDLGQSRWTGTDAFPTIEIDDFGGAHNRFYNLAPPPQHFSASDTGIVPTSETSNTSAGARGRKRRVKPARRGRIVEIFAGLLLSLTAAVVGVWQVTKRDRPIHGPRDDGTLGLPHLQRWADTYQTPRFEGIRRVSPRFQFSGIAMVAIAITVVTLLGALVYGQLAGRVQERAAGIDERLQSIAAVRLQAETTPDTLVAYESLIDAEEALDTMAATASDDDVLQRIQDEQLAVSQMLDSLMAVERLTSIQVMGSVPAAPESVTPRLFAGNGRVFILTDGLYELDRTTGSLIELLKPGDEVGGLPVGTLLAADWGDDRPLVIDSQNTFTLDLSTGDWQRTALGTVAPEGYTNVAAIAAFDRNLYMLTPESGQILKFDSLDFGAPPEDWTAGVAKDALRNGVDLIVDGSIHVALHDGQMLSFFRSALESTVMAGVAPPVSGVSAFMAGDEGQLFYLISGSDGRIICMDQDGTVMRQFIPAAGAPSLVGATDIVFDEASSIAHVIAENTLYAVRLTIPKQ
jgi:hypothetical protein